MTRTLNKNGDTIVEVLLAIAISSFVLVAGYASVDNSILTERQAQERSEAVQMVQSQTESLDALYNTYPTTAKKATFVSSLGSGQFCINGTTIINIGASYGCNFNQQSISATSPTGWINQATTVPYYTIAMTVTNPINTPFTVDQVSVNASWTKAGGGGNDALDVAYRLN